MKSLRVSLAVLVAAVMAACAAAPDGGVIHLRNDSDRAVMMSLGGLLNDDPGIAVRPCGGGVDVPVAPDSYQDDGRLMAMLAIDPTGSFDVAVAQHEGDPSDVPVTYTAEILWSDGTLAGRLPLYLTVSSDMEVTASDVPTDPASGSCEPAY